MGGKKENNVEPVLPDFWEDSLWKHIIYAPSVKGRPTWKLLEKSAVRRGDKVAQAGSGFNCGKSQWDTGGGTMGDQVRCGRGKLSWAQKVVPQTPRRAQQAWRRWQEEDILVIIKKEELERWRLNQVVQKMDRCWLSAVQMSLPVD